MPVLSESWAVLRMKEVKIGLIYYKVFYEFQVGPFIFYILQMRKG